MFILQLVILPLISMISIVNSQLKGLNFFVVSAIYVLQRILLSLSMSRKFDF